MKKIIIDNRTNKAMAEIISYVERGLEHFEVPKKPDGIFLSFPDGILLKTLRNKKSIRFVIWEKG
jgi:hypothetical protein